MNTRAANRPPFVMSEIFPGLSEELQKLLRKEGQSSLAASVAELAILDRCRCGDDFCATFYTQPKPKGSYGPGHDTIPLEPEHGMLIIDVLNGEIACVEALYRDEIRQKLLELFP